MSSNITTNVRPTYSAVMHQQHEHKPSEALDKLTASDTGFLSSIVHTAAQAGGAAMNVASSAANKAKLIKTLSVEALETAKEMGHDAAVLASSSLDSAKHLALDAAADLSASAHVKAADISSSAQQARVSLSHAASVVSSVVHENLALLSSSSLLASIAPRPQLPFTEELIAHSHLALFKRELLQRTSWVSQRSALPFAAELLSKHGFASRVSLPFASELLARGHLSLYKNELLQRTSWSGSFSGPLPFTSELLSRSRLSLFKKELLQRSTPLPFASELLSRSRLSLFKSELLQRASSELYTSRQPLPFLQELLHKRSALPSDAPLAFSRDVKVGEELFAQEKVEKELKSLNLTMDVVAHLQRIADRTGDALLHETARKAHSAFARGLSEAAGVHLTSVNSQQANELLNLAIQTQNRELADFARYCQSVADTTQIAVEPTPGKIMQEIEKGRQQLLSQGRVHVGPGYGAAFASVDNKNKRISGSFAATPAASAPQLEKASEAVSTGSLGLTMEVVAHIQRIADRTGDALLHETARKAHSACAKGLQEAPGVHLTTVTPQQANELLNLAIQTQNRELADFARYCQSVAATTQIAVEPTPGKIMQEIEKGRQTLQSQGRIHTGPGYGAAFASVASNAQGQRKENRKSGSFEAKVVVQELPAVSSPIGTGGR